ncbi:MAG TPA: EamA family transporter [Candidatus Saccharicenans sp.]|nr:EamA family transporter [Candidatus Saccharicenans sp.]HPP23674.1 EamA family transporter [Candidatus Saccharicenans sp.]HQI22306.1 EamA family transporter [Candidatus Saccharicenans sp.]HRV05979.1 EamA family transporter [Candidatus Saccharicenans sp.]
MGWLFLLLAIAGYVAMNFVMKLGSRRGLNSSELTGSLFALASLYCLLILIFSGQALNFTPAVILLALAGGAGGAVAYFFFLQALKIGSYALTISIYTMTFLNPVIFSIIFWDRQVTTLITLGILLIIAGIIFISLAGSTPESQKSGLFLKWLIFLTATFFLTGIPQISQAAAVRLAEINLWSYLFVTFLAGALVFIIYLAAKKTKLPRQALSTGALAAAGSVAGNFFTLKALTGLPEPVVFPVIQAGPIIAAVILSLAYFKEKIKPGAYFGIILGLAGIILLTLS